VPPPIRSGTTTTAASRKWSSTDGTRPVISTELDASLWTRASGFRPTTLKRAPGISASTLGQISEQKYSMASIFGSQSIAPTKTTSDDWSSDFCGVYCFKSTPVGTTDTLDGSVHADIKSRS